MSSASAQDRPIAAKALDGLQVVDASRVLAGPLCATMLGDHGAKVIKVEPPQGDDTRDLGPPFYGDTAAYFYGVNRNKRGLALDLARAGGRAVLLRLLERTDVFIENFKPGTMESWGIGYEQALAQRYPRLIYCRISGFGASGPLGGLPGYDAIAQAYGGLMGVNGTPASGALRAGVPVADILAGTHAFGAILLALVERSRSGLGQAVESTLYDAALSMLHPHSESYFGSGVAPGLMGNAHANIVPYDKFRAADGEVFLGVLNDAQFARLCEFLGTPALATDARFARNADRVAHRADLTAELEARLRGLGVEVLCTGLMARGVPVAPVYSMGSALEHPHAAARRMVVEVDGKRALGVPMKLERTPGAAGDGAPRFAAHSREILRAAGYEDTEIDALIAGGDVAVERKK